MTSSSKMTAPHCPTGGGGEYVGRCRQADRACRAPGMGAYVVRKITAALAEQPEADPDMGARERPPPG